MKFAGRTVNWCRLSCTKNGELIATRSLDIRKIKGVSQVSGHSVGLYDEECSARGQVRDA